MSLPSSNMGTTFGGLVPHCCAHCQDIVLDSTNITSKDFSPEFTFSCEEALYAALGGCALFFWCCKARWEKSGGLLPRPDSKLRIYFETGDWSKISYAELEWLEEDEPTLYRTELGTFHVFATSGI